MRTYQELSLDERITIQVERGGGRNVQSIGRLLNRSASTISRELRRNGPVEGYRAGPAQNRARGLLRKPRVARKLDDASLWSRVCGYVKRGWSPWQAARRLRREHADDKTMRVSHETIYKAIYLVPRGELRQDLIGCLRQRRKTRLPRTRGRDRRGQI